MNPANQKVRYMKNKKSKNRINFSYTIIYNAAKHKKTNDNTSTISREEKQRSNNKNPEFKHQKNNKDTTTKMNQNQLEHIKNKQMLIKNDKEPQEVSTLEQNHNSGQKNEVGFTTQYMGKPVFIEPIDQSFSEDKELEYQEIQLLANSSILLADFKKFYPETIVQQNQTSLRIPSSNRIYTYAVAYLQYLITKSKQSRIIKLKKQIIYCDFGVFYSGNQLIQQIIEEPIQFKRLALKIVRQIVEQKSVYKVLLYYDVDEIITFLFQCLILNNKKQNSFKALKSDSIQYDFLQCFEFKLLEKDTFLDSTGQKLIVKLNYQQQNDIVKIQ